MPSKIEWLRNTDGKPGYTINPIKGLCPMDCKDNQGKSYCYARRMYLNPYYKYLYNHRSIEFYPAVLDEIAKIPAGSKIFMHSTIEAFGDWIKPEWLEAEFNHCRIYSDHTFIFLTKQPQNLIKWSPYPRNCHVGVSATNWNMAFNACWELQDVKATVKFLSFEPLLERIIHPVRDFEGWLKRSNINWLIIGRQTPLSAKTAPKIEWIRELVESADKAGIPIFLKNNLWETLFHSEQVSYDDPFWTKNGRYELCQEFPKL